MAWETQILFSHCIGFSLRLFTSQCNLQIASSYASRLLHRASPINCSYWWNKVKYKKESFFKDELIQSEVKKRACLVANSQKKRHRREMCWELERCHSPPSNHLLNSNLKTLRNMPLRWNQVKLCKREERKKLTFREHLL